MAAPPCRGPKRAKTLSRRISRLAVRTELAGLVSESRISASNLWPRTPPASLISLTAMLMPWLVLFPTMEYRPVSGERTPIFMVFAANEVETLNKPIARIIAPAKNAFFLKPDIRSLPSG